MNKIKIGISACVAGQQVRFDKSHKRSSFCMDVLTEYVDFVPVCPEMAVGLPTPRPTVRQIESDNVIIVSRPDGSSNITQGLIEYGNKVANSYKDLSGFIFCAKSPSCGMERVKVYDSKGNLANSNGVGLFAKQIMDNHPHLPCEENGRLNDAKLRENFILRVFLLHQWQQMLREGLTKHQLFDFHASNKYLLMAHCIPSYQQLGKLLATSTLELAELAELYINTLMAALKKVATRKAHSNTLYHLLGYFKKDLNKQQKAMLCQQIDDYSRGISPLLAPLTLIQHFLTEYPKPYLAKQRYLSPYPKELRLRYGY